MSSSLEPSDADLMPTIAKIMIYRDRPMKPCIPKLIAIQSEPSNEGLPLVAMPRVAHLAPHLRFIYARVQSMIA